MPPDNPADRILLTGVTPGGDRVDLVAYADGRCGIAVNGVPDPRRQWAPCDPDASALALLRAVDATR